MDDGYDEAQVIDEDQDEDERYDNRGMAATSAYQASQ